MDAQVGQEYTSLGPEQGKFMTFRNSLNRRILTLSTCAVLVTGSALIMSSSRGSSSNDEILDLLALPSMRGGTSVQARNLMTLTGPASKWKNLALTALQLNDGCNPVGARDVRMQAAMSNMNKESKDALAKLMKHIVVKAEQIQAQEMASNTTSEATSEAPAKPINVKEMAGITGPLGFFDPLGYSADVSDGKLLFYREAELKHGRVCMLATLGILVAEKFHPMFGGNIDAPAAFAFFVSNKYTPANTLAKRAGRTE